MTHTYFLLNEHTGLLKIGRTRSLVTRRRDLENMGGVRLRLLGTLDGDCEHEWHDRFKAHRVLGEWFRLEPSVAEELRNRFGWRVRSPREGPPRRERATIEDFRHDLEARSGFALRDPVDEDDLLDDLVTLATPPDAELEAESADVELDAEDAERWEQTEWDDRRTAAAAIAARIEAWRGCWLGWITPSLDAVPPDDGCIDVWLVFWAPRGEVSRTRLRWDMLCAAQYSDHDAVARLRLRPVLVDPTTGAPEELPPEELYSDEALLLFMRYGEGSI